MDIALKKEKDRFEALFEYASLGIVFTDANAHIEMVNHVEKLLQSLHTVPYIEEHEVALEIGFRVQRHIGHVAHVAKRFAAATPSGLQAVWLCSWRVASTLGVFTLPITVSKLKAFCLS